MDNSNWVEIDKKLVKELIFTDFVTAFSFMTAVAFEAEKANHHPNWENVYNKVKITLWTHSANGLTEKDFSLAQKIDAIYDKFAEK
jgi:4a-hydroxytetrahydrobiopterin dehydratase